MAVDGVEQPAIEALQADPLWNSFQDVLRTYLIDDGFLSRPDGRLPQPIPPGWRLFDHLDLDSWGMSELVAIVEVDLDVFLDDVDLENTGCYGTTGTVYNLYGAIKNAKESNP